MKTKKSELIRTYAQSVGVETAKDLIARATSAAALEDKEKYSKEEIARICGELAKKGGLIRIVTQSFLVQLERKRAEEQTLLLDNIDTQIWYLTDVETYGAVNKARAEFLGIAPEHLEDKNLRDTLNREETETSIARNREVFEQKEQTHTEEWATNGNGETRLLAVTRTPKLDDNGNVGYVICAAEDITVRKQAEKRIRHLNSTLRAIRNVNQLIVVEKDRASLLRKSCDALVEARGYDAAWLGFLKNGEGFTIVAGSGSGEETSRIAEQLMRGNPTHCVKTMLAQKEKLLVFDKRRECGECPFRSAHAGHTTVIIRVEHGGQHFGLLAISLGADITADQEERGLLIEVADDIAIALRNMELEEAHKQADQDLRESEEKFRDLAELLPQIVYEMGTRGNLTFANRNAFDSFGYTQHEFDAGLNALHMLVPEDRDRARENIQGTLIGERSEAIEYTALRKDGSTFPVIIYSSPIIHDNEPVGFRGIIVDITERVRAEEALRESEERYRTVVEAIPALVCRFSADGTLTFVNEAYGTYIGRKRADLIGKDLFDVIPEEYCAKVRTHLDALTQEQPTVTYQNRLTGPDGEELYQQWTEKALFAEDGSIAEYQSVGIDVTERVRAEQALRQSEERYRLLAENAADVIWTMDMDLRFTYVSPSAIRLSGYSVEEAMAQTFEEMLTPDSTEVALKTYAQAAAAEAPGSQVASQTSTLELEQVCKDGSMIWAETVATIFRDPDGRPLGILGVTRDITERKQAEENLRESQERYRAVVDTQAEMICRFLPDGTVTFANEAYCRNAGKPVEEVLGHTFWTRILEEDRQMVRQHQDSLSPGNPTTSYIHRFSSPDGEVRWQQWTVRAIFDQRDELVEYQSMGQDITKRMRAEENLHRRDAILEAIGHAATRLLTETNWEQNIEEVLTRLGQATGVGRVSLFGNRLGDDGDILTSYLFEWNAPGLTLPVDDSERSGFPLAAGGFARWEEILGRGDLIHGHVRDFPTSEREKLVAGQLPIKSTAVVPIFLGQTWWGFLAFDDYLAERTWSKAEIEALKTAASLLGAAIQHGQAEKEKTRLEANLRQSQKMQAIGQLAGGVAHDFNNILTVIQGYTEFALMSIGEDDPVRRDLNEVRRASARAANLTRQLLLFSRRQPMAMRSLDINRTVQDLTKMLVRLIGEEIALTTNLEHNLWTIEGDSGTIQQAIMNLVVNARDALPQGGEISIQTQNLRVDEKYCRTCADARPGEFVCLSVTDTGIGMSPDIIDRIFEPFFTTKEPGKGTGMGLPVVYGIVNQHGGWIDVESSPGQGTTFRVYLPATFTRPTEEPESSVLIEASRGQGEHILLVEDEDSVRELTSRGLSQHGYVVYPAASAQEALDIFKQEEGKFDLIFCDLVLTDGSGLKLAQRLLDIRPNTKVIFASGYSADKEDWGVIHEEGHPFLQKPYSLSDLLGLVREVLG